ncbi:MAG: type II toxin-antitoxin system RelE/ParE family toxin [Deltaproteobacteria bacterium]|nr:type II toxin-antitoxin system RelE/ParE family toxin [Deltaproteobacteria bacterium]
MAAYKVEFVKSARKEFDRLPTKTQAKTIEALNLLSQNPYSELLKIKKLKGADALYRIRLGDYRIIYEVRNDRLVILVIKIGHRREVYRGL